MTAVRCPVNEAAFISRDEPALILDDRKITYSEFEFYVAGAAARLRKAGCRAGDRVALGVREPWQAAVLLMALLRVKAVACLLAGEEDGAGKAARAECGIRIGGPAPGLDAESLLPVCIEGQDSAEASSLALEQSATVLFLADRDGGLRAVLHTYGNHYYGARGANHAVRLSSHGRWLSAPPLYTGAGLSAFFRCLLSGAALVLPEPGCPLRESLARHEVTHASVTPGDLEDIAERRASADFPKLRAVLVESDEVQPALLRKARAAGWPVFPGYGIPEMASGISTVMPDSPPPRRDGAGLPMKYREVRVSEAGEILVRGPALFAGYVEPGVLRRPVDGDGWFSTGARGRMESDGYLTVAAPDAKAG
ncbi:MAG TPA: AMP-binding protein [Kiritimatiellia bacterium]|nr:AMP-binding protein [Kiritimatiellia bacterium]HRZ12189.1 AMP-binding protein [Kiritimatiellia bacterium]HSA18053.1 AMP-binding protein [Kiritimatiellia bacterium]